VTAGVVSGKAALVVAHPGHELCVYGWLEEARPRVFVLTDGSGRSGISRLKSTTKILSGAGASPGAVYGRFGDRELYAALLRGDFGLFERLVAELAEAFVWEEIEYVAGDAAEGYNPLHDTCRIVIDAAAELASRTSGRQIINRDFLLFRRHGAVSDEVHAGGIRLTLDNAQLARKLSVAREYSELKAEVDALLDQKALEALRAFPELSAHISDFVTSDMGGEAYRVESLRPAGEVTREYGAANEIPFYERYGEMLVAAGAYEHAIRRREHIAPLAKAVRRFVDAQL
jgi:AcrR family transcriptional regulator